MRLPPPSGSFGVAARPHGPLRMREVTRRTHPDEGPILVVVAEPDLDLAEACGQVGRAYPGTWPPVVVLPAHTDVGADDAAAGLERALRDQRTIALRGRFLALVREALAEEAVADSDYFFVDAGGDSVTALELSAATEAEFGFELPLEVLVTLAIGHIAQLVATACIALGSGGSAADR